MSLTPEQIAAGLSTKAMQAIKGIWPRDVVNLHPAHIRHFNRLQLICDHSLTHYRLTPLGEEVRAIAYKEHNHD